MQKIEDKWFKKKATCSNPSTTSASSNSLTLSLDSFWGLFIVAGVASSLALLIFAAMFFHEHRHTLTSFDPAETSFWSRIRVVLRLYDQREPNWDDYNGTPLQNSVHAIIGAVEPSPNTNDVHFPPRPSSTESHIAIEELGTPPADTELCDLNLNGQATRPRD